MIRLIRSALIGAALAACPLAALAADGFILPEPAPGDGIVLAEPEPAVPANPVSPETLSELWAADPAAPAVVLDFAALAILAQAAPDAAVLPDDVPPGLLNNVHYKESLRQKKLADENFEAGDYDAAAFNAAEAARYARLSDEYITAQLRLKADADAAALAARLAAEEAARRQADADRLAAEEAARRQAEADRLAAEEAARRQAEADRLAAEEAARRQAEADRLAAEEAARRQAEADRLAAEEADRRQAEADRLAAEEAARLAAAIREVDAAIAAAAERLAWAVSIGADEVSPQPYAASRTAFDAAGAAKAGGDWPVALTQAQRAYDLLDGIKGYAVLPALYTVRPWSDTKDCFWTIAGYPWVYGDATKWKVLYEANRKKLKLPENPDLLNIGIVLDIPSLLDEERTGAWSPTEAYRSVAKAK